MEKLKRVLAKFFFNEEVKPEENKTDHIITVEDTDGRRSLKRVTTIKKEKDKKFINSKFSFCIDVLLRCLFCLIWAVVFSIFVRVLIAVPFDKLSFHEYIYIGCFILVLIVSIISIQFDSLFIKLVDKCIIQISVVVRQSQKRSLVLRIRKAGAEKEFIETELDENKLTYEDVMQLCCEELNVERERVMRLCKVPDTRIRGDADVKRFRRVEYLEIHVC